mgnify:CR=1 FL=1|jgi:hypothetical protein
MLSNTKKRPRKEQEFFEDPAIDRLMGTVMALASEVFVLRSRLTGLETQLAKTDLVDITHSANEAQSSTNLAEAEAFAEALLKPLLGLQASIGDEG